MPKFYVVSDIHGFYDEFKEALDKAGFDPTNPDHYLISCGDHFDRGPKNREVMNYLMSLDRCILIRGNHEDLLEDMVQRGFPMWNDYSNGTVATINEFNNGANITPAFFDNAYNIIRPFFDSMLNYFETKNYVFVHGWFPVAKGKDWRHQVHASKWRKARWYNGMQEAIYYKNLDPLGKTVVCGHWHTSWGHNRMDESDEWGPAADYSPFYAEGIIAIDACTAASHQVNILVIEDDFMEVSE